MDDLRQRAREHYDRNELRQCREMALRGLEQAADDVELLRLAGQCGVELAAPDAVEQLRRVTELQPDDDQGWRELGDALAAEGRMREASEAWSKAIKLRPRDSLVLTALGHAALLAGVEDEAASHLAQAAEVEPRNWSATMGLIDLYRDAGRREDALDVARRAWEADPGDALAGIDVAELSLELDRLQEADAAFARLRELDEDEPHEIYVLYGLIRVAMAREDWAAATDLAVQATHVDASRRTADLLAYVAHRALGSLDRAATTPVIGAAFAAAESGMFALPVPTAETGREPPSRADVDAALDRARAEHRRLYVEQHALDDEGTS